MNSVPVEYVKALGQAMVHPLAKVMQMAAMDGATHGTEGKADVAGAAEAREATVAKQCAGLSASSHIGKLCASVLSHTLFRT